MTWPIIWCMGIGSLSCALLAIATMVARPRLSGLRPVLLVRGCLASLLLALSLGLAAAALSIALTPPPGA